MRTKVYLASAYTHIEQYVRDERVQRANRIAAKLMQRGLIVFSPLSHSDGIDRYTTITQSEHTFWMRQCMEFVKWADVMYVVQDDGNKDSRGLVVELRYCIKQKKPIFVIDSVTFQEKLIDKGGDLCLQEILSQL